MDYSLLFPLIVILVLLKISEMHIQNNKLCYKKNSKFEGYKEDIDNIELSSDDDAYIPDFKPVHIDFENHGASSEFDPEIQLNEFLNDKNAKNATLDTAYGVDPPKYGHTDKDDLLYLYDSLQGPVDQGMATVMSAISKRSKESLTNQNRKTKYTFEKYFVDELEDHENARWWDNNELDVNM